jgi:hypothetical protein
MRSRTPQVDRLVRVEVVLRCQLGRREPFLDSSGICLAETGVGQLRRGPDFSAAREAGPMPAGRIFPPATICSKLGVGGAGADWL